MSEIEQFLAELSALSKKYGFAIVPAPCCNAHPAVVRCPADGKYCVSDKREDAAIDLEWQIRDWN